MLYLLNEMKTNTIMRSLRPSILFQEYLALYLVLVFGPNLLLPIKPFPYLKRKRAILLNILYE